jgi:hypothetical protein
MAGILVLALAALVLALAGLKTTMGSFWAFSTSILSLRYTGVLILIGSLALTIHAGQIRHGRPEMPERE